MKIVSALAYGSRETRRRYGVMEAVEQRHTYHLTAIA